MRACVYDCFVPRLFGIFWCCVKFATLAQLGVGPQIRFKNLPSTFDDLRNGAGYLLVLDYISVFPSCRRV